MLSGSTVGASLNVFKAPFGLVGVVGGFEHRQCAFDLQAQALGVGKC